MTVGPGSKPRPLATLLVVVAAGGMLVLAARQMRGRLAEVSSASASASVGTVMSAPQVGSGPRIMVAPIPPAITSTAGKQGVARIDVTLRVDGLDLTLDGAPVCRDGHKRLIGRSPGGGSGSFDERALDACISTLVKRVGTRVPVALVTRAGPAVPSTSLDAIAATLRRSGIGEVILSP